MIATLKKTKLNPIQAVALDKLKQFGWSSTYDFGGRFSANTFNALIKKGLVEKRQKPGWSHVTQYRAVQQEDNR